MANPARKSVPQLTQANILVESHRRCAMCFHLEGDLAQKSGQLAHIDRDRSNDVEQNLVFLCLAHHDEYDAKQSQSKGWQPAELREIKRRFLQAIAGKRHLGTRVGGVTAGRQTDAKALDGLIASMAPTMRLLRGMNFAGHSFSYDQLDGLLNVVDASAGAEHEFIDAELEGRRRALIETGEALFSALARQTQKLSYNAWHAVPRHWEQDHPERFHEAVATLNGAAAEVCRTYDELIRLGRARLSP